MSDRTDTETSTDCGTTQRSDASSTESDAGPPRSDAAQRRTAADASAFYDRWARLYDLIASHAPGVGRLRRRAVDALRLDRGDTVVEIGCGTGANLPLLAREVGPRGTVIGIDRSRGVLERARQNARGYPQVEVLRADGTQLPIVGPNDLATPAASASTTPAGSSGETTAEIDGVLATFVVGMLEDPAASVGEWIEQLAPDGHVALLHLRRSEGALAPIANPALHAATVLSTPPTTKLRYERDLSRLLDERVRAAGDVVRARTTPTLTESHLFDLVELTAGRRA